MPTKAQLEEKLAEAKTGLASAKAEVEALQARVAELEAGAPLPGNGSAATLQARVKELEAALEAPRPLTCFIRVLKTFVFEKTTLTPGTHILSPSKALLTAGAGCWAWVDERSFRVAGRRLHRTEDGWTPWQEA